MAGERILFYGAAQEGVEGGGCASALYVTPLSFRRVKSSFTVGNSADSYGCSVLGGGCDEGTGSQNTTKAFHPNSRPPVQPECFLINEGGGATPDFARDGF